MLSCMTDVGGRVHIDQGQSVYRQWSIDQGCTHRDIGPCVQPISLLLYADAIDDVLHQGYHTISI